MTSNLKDSNTASKTYWSILNRFVYNKKIPVLPPSLADVNFISNFCEKASLFNNFLAPIKNNSRLSPSIYKTNTEFTAFVLRKKDKLSIINSLNSSKAHGYDNI